MIYGRWAVGRPEGQTHMPGTCTCLNLNDLDRYDISTDPQCPIHGQDGTAPARPGPGRDGPVYLALNDTDNSTAYVVQFPDTAAYERWYASFGDNEEPFGFQGQWGLAYAILSPERLLQILGRPLPM
jgi:hypothetical protein